MKKPSRFKEKVARIRKMLVDQRPATNAQAAAFRAFDEPRHRRTDRIVAIGVIFMMVYAVCCKIAGAVYEAPLWHQLASLSTAAFVITAIVWIVWYFKRYREYLMSQVKR